MRRRYSGLLATALLVASTTVAGAQAPQDPTPQNVMQQFMVMTIVASQCNPPKLSLEKETALGEVAKTMQAKTGQSDADMMQDFQRLATQIVTPDCETWNKGLPDQVDALLALAERVP